MSKCQIKPKEGKPCKDDIVFTFRAKVEHEPSGRITWQTWKLCGYHWTWFHREKGKGWHRWYKDPNHLAFVIDYEEPIM